MSSLSIVDARKDFGAVSVLKGVSINVVAGEFLVLVGPSGCGKSTLLRSIAGLEALTAGDILIDGRRVNDLPPKDRDIAMVFQSYALYPHMTVAQNMGFALKLRGTPKAEIARRVGEAADILGLRDLLDRQPKALSGGQRQRVAMGRAIVRDPRVFLFDEPLSNLDAKLRVQMRGEIKRLHQRLRTTTVYVTHDQVEAMTMADRIVVMRGGEVEQVGRPLDLYDRPVSTFVATFIGSPAMNLLPGRIDGWSRSFRPDAGGELPLPDAAAADGTRALYGIRPEHLVVDPEGPLEIELTLVEPMGFETLCTGLLGEQPVTILLRDRIELAPGARLRASPIRDHGHLFDAQSGRRL